MTDPSFPFASRLAPFATECQCPGKFTTATRADASVMSFHGSNRRMHEGVAKSMNLLVDIR